VSTEAAQNINLNHAMFAILVTSQGYVHRLSLFATSLNVLLSKSHFSKKEYWQQLISTAATTTTTTLTLPVENRFKTL